MIIEFEGPIQTVERTDYWHEPHEWDGSENREPHVESYYHVELPHVYRIAEVQPLFHIDEWKIEFSDDPGLTPGMRVKVRIEIEQTFEEE